MLITDSSSCSNKQTNKQIDRQTDKQTKDSGGGATSPRMDRQYGGQVTSPEYLNKV